MLLNLGRKVLPKCNTLITTLVQEPSDDVNEIHKSFDMGVLIESAALAVAVMRIHISVGRGCIRQWVANRAVDAIGCGAAEGGSPGREPWECAGNDCEAAEQRRLPAHIENQRRCFAAFSYQGYYDLRFHRRLPTTAAPQRIAQEPPTTNGRTSRTASGRPSLAAYGRFITLATLFLKCIHGQGQKQERTGDEW